MIEQLPSLLTWRTRHQDLAAVHEDYEMFAMERVRLALSQLSIAGDEPQRFERLPSESKRRLVLAPEVCRQVVVSSRIMSGQTTRFLIESLIAEEWRCGNWSFHRGGVWTALGDARYIGPGNVDTTYMPRGIDDDGCVPVDYSSPYCHGSGTIGLGRRADFHPREWGSIYGKINCGLNILRQGCPNAHRLFRGAVKVVTLLRDPSGASSFGSSSWSRYIGKLALSNVHNEGFDPLRIAQALVHEAVHSALYVIERREPFIVSLNDQSYDRKVCSPWTKRELPLASYLHACFVWYGLWCFWHRAIESGVVAVAEAAPHLEKAASGFRQASLLDAVAEHTSVICPGLLPLYTTMNDVVASARQ
jgi:hypothetical protein